ncbi:FixH family protein [Xylophilus sp. ASV27]|uniref:FixH family protein n=1 Tax=Xylophilus sp. ASV27 TaxID=2795129 RepID=UPI001E56A76D|nr:FixH family protein [Xylophilus sp. ASV27]
MTEKDDASSPCPPWYRFPLVWMVIGGPGIVVIASFVTLWLALGTPDPVVDQDYYRKGVEINRTLADKKLMPALAGRNHAATPGSDVPAPRR